MALKRKGSAITVESAGYGTGGTDPDVTLLENGNLVMVWSENVGQPTDAFQDTDGAIFLRVLNSQGIPIGEIIQVNEARIAGTDRTAEWDRSARLYRQRCR
jgi:hypothetical protein